MSTNKENMSVLEENERDLIKYKFYHQKLLNSVSDDIPLVQEYIQKTSELIGSYEGLSDNGKNAKRYFKDALNIFEALIAKIELEERHANGKV